MEGGPPSSPGGAAVVSYPTLDSILVATGSQEPDLARLGSSVVFGYDEACLFSMISLDSLGYSHTTEVFDEGEDGDGAVARAFREDIDGYIEAHEDANDGEGSGQNTDVLLISKLLPRYVRLWSKAPPLLLRIAAARARREFPSPFSCVSRKQSDGGCVAPTPSCHGLLRRTPRHCSTALQPRRLGQLRICGRSALPALREAQSLRRPADGQPHHHIPPPADERHAKGSPRHR